MLITTTDNYNLQTSRNFTPENFLVAPGYVARTGTQDYLASELGLPGDPMRIVKVHRPSEEVFKPESLASFDGVDITLNHPDNFVNASNYKKVSCGVIRGIGVQDGEHIRCELIVKDQETIDRINAGTCQLSVGYEAEYHEAPKDSGYDYIQRNIKVNHVAVVDLARAGPTAKIFDQEGVKKMLKLKIGDAEHEVSKDVHDYVAKLTADKDKAEAERDNERDEVKRLKEERKEDDFDVKELRKEVKELKDSKNAIETKAVADQAFVLTGKTCDGATPLEVKKSALVHTGVTVDGKSDAYIEARYDMIVESKTTTDSQHQSLAGDLTAPPVTQTSDADSVLQAAQQNYIKSLEKGAK